MPITVLVDRLLQGQITAPEAIVALMSRDRKSE
jgi:glycerol-3-phosphate dehydrogenase (NAD(P)+)